MTDQKKSKITNPERLRRILHKMCTAGMQALLRTGEDANLGIRAVFTNLDESPTANLISLTGISDKGRQRLEGAEHVRVEVLGMPTRVMFVSRLIRQTTDGAILGLPEALISVERRQNTRYQTSPKQMAYVKLGLWTPNEHDLAAPPQIPHLSELVSWYPIADISMGGICILTHFPSVLSVVESGKIDEKAQVIFPMIDPVTLPLQIRWQKRTIDRNFVGGVEQSQRQFRIGVEFVQPNDELKLKIRQFMRQLSMADAI